MAKIFTREEFYQLVWSKPLTHLAKEFAISDVALHKICRKHDIPHPPLGWWAKQAAGKEVMQTPLPKVTLGTSEKITIANADFNRETSALAGVREQARILASEGSDDQAVPPHPIVERSLAGLRKAKSSDIGIIAVSGSGLIKCEVASASVDRLAIALPRIVRATSLQGFTLVSGENSAEFKSDSETLGFSITELIKREKHVLTDTERAEEQAWQRKRDRAVQRNSWDGILFGGPRFAEWDYHPTGQLSFEFEHVYVMGGTAPRRSYRDAKVQRLENMASDIAVGMTVLSAAKTEQRRLREAEQRRIEEQRRRREQAARIKHIEDRRTSGLVAIFSELEELERFRRLIVRLTEDVPSEPTPRLMAFLDWAKENLQKRETRLSARSIEDRFEAERLFGDDDDHGCKPTGWY